MIHIRKNQVEEIYSDMDADLIPSCLPIPNPGHPVTGMVTIWVLGGMCFFSFSAADLEVQVSPNQGSKPTVITP